MKHLEIKKKLYLLGAGVCLLMLISVLVSARVPGLALLVLAAIFALVMIRQIDNSLQSAENVVLKMAKGDFSENDDESLEGLGSFAESSEMLREKVKTLLEGAREETSALKQAAGGIRSQAAMIESGIEDAAASAGVLSGSFGELEASAKEAERLAGGLLEEAKDMALHAKEGEARASAIYARAMEAREEAAERHGMAREDQSLMKDSLLRALEDIKTVEKISVLAETIMGITEQTNLLSLNAGVEASRAGETGREFVIAADQIRKLASESRQSVESIQWVTGEVEAAVSQIKRDTERLLAFADDNVVSSLEHLNHVADAYCQDAEEAGDLAHEFQKASERLLAPADGIVDSLEKMEGMSFESAQKAERLKERMREIAAKAGAIGEPEKDRKNE